MRAKGFPVDPHWSGQVIWLEILSWWCALSRAVTVLSFFQGLQMVFFFPPGTVCRWKKFASFCHQSWHVPAFYSRGPEPVSPGELGCSGCLFLPVLSSLTMECLGMGLLYLSLGFSEFVEFVRWCFLIQSGKPLAMTSLFIAPVPPFHSPSGDLISH